MASKEQMRIEDDCLSDLLSYKSGPKMVQSLIKRLNECERDDSFKDKPDIVLCDKKSNVIYGLEHFRVNSSVQLNEKNKLVFGDNQYRKIICDIYEKGHTQLKNDDMISDDVLRGLFLSVLDVHDILKRMCYDDYIKSFNYGFSKHLEKIQFYRDEIHKRYNIKSNIYFLVEIFFPFNDICLPIQCGCITRPILFEIEKIREQCLLDGIIFLMRDFLEFTKYSVLFIDMLNYEKSIKKQSIEQNNVENMFKKLYRLRNVSLSDFKFIKHDDLIDICYDITKQINNCYYVLHGGFQLK